MKFRPMPALLSRESIICIFFTAGVYMAAILLGKFVFQLIHGNELRVVTFIPAVTGLLWGLPAAVGSGIGSILAALVWGDKLITELLPGLGNFMLAYVPFALWYRLGAKNWDLFVYDCKSLVKLLACLVAGGSICCAFIVGDASIFYDFSLFRLTKAVWATNVLFPICVGIPLLLFLRTSRITAFYPQCLEGKFRERQNLPLGLYIIRVIFSLGMMYSIWYTYVTTASVYSYFSGLKDIALWKYMLENLAGSMFVMLVVIYIVLLLVERDIVNRLYDTTAMVRSFITKDESGKEYYQSLQNTTALASDYNDELEELRKSFVTMDRDIKDYIFNMEQFVREKTTVQAQMEVASSIQMNALPDIVAINSTVSGYIVKGDMTPAKKVGGDLNICFRVDEDHLALGVGDVSGKGIPAAVFMMAANTLLQQCFEGNANLEYNSPGHILSFVNRQLANQNEDMMFMTCWLGLLEISSGKMIYANAGHNPPVLAKAGQVEWIKKKSGPPLGVVKNKKYKEFELQLEPDAKLLVYTDGFNEAENMDKDLFGNDRLVEAMEGAQGPEDIVVKVRDFVGTAEQSDDMTYMWLERHDNTSVENK